MSSKFADSLIERIERRDIVFGLVGLGYVGLPLAVELARAGYRVLGYDVNARVVDGLNAGRSHVRDVTDAQLREIASVSPSLMEWLREVPLLSTPLAESVRSLQEAAGDLKEARALLGRPVRATEPE